MKIQKLRKKAYKLLRRFAEEENENEHFRKFECEGSFVGYTLSELNTKLYVKKAEYLDRKIRQCKLLIGEEI